ncbi:proton-conducting transporter membrane subunit [Wenyingzhuangia sp. chi5]|uniref:Proton-conducting transporter membrane subunit n=1 Tax=Wenyingzhuangia gilva TaxID=3057677 RepID=A0ABT8VPT2_9FLAO|nr:proton-conducting transporter membrane subunit [Wenyingzhuangia sp. chi5]MDO3693980.1 proton-conducting transporter membrane subunit [Wenyingzhuangia sp. chi5]
MILENNLDHSITQKKDTLFTFSKINSLFFWLLFIVNLGALFYYYPDGPQWEWKGIFRINGFTLLIWCTVAFFSAIVSSYGKNYLKGFRYHQKFIFLCFGFTSSVMVLVMSNHVVPLLISWLFMGVFMSNLIGVDSDWGEAKKALKFAQKYFLIGTFFLSLGVLLLAYQTKTFTLNGILSKLNDLHSLTLLLAAFCIIISGVIQSAIYPFHRWLLSAMTAPTPASALMHAGFVNGSGILFAMFSPLFFASNTLNILLIIGGVTAIVAQFTKLLQVNIKQKLVCSTIAQMGFMIMQCGLGFFNAAVVHLILHGFYKAYLFLSAGEGIKHSTPEKHIPLRITFSQAIVVLIFGIIGGVVFATLTGKGTELNSSIFLTLVVAITVGQITYNIVKEKSLSMAQKTLISPLLFLSGISFYAIIYNAVSLLMSDMPMVNEHLSLSIIQIVFGVVFLIGFFIMKLGIYRRIPWLYVKLLNDSQPYKKSVLMFKSTSL